MPRNGTWSDTKWKVQASKENPGHRNPGFAMATLTSYAASAFTKCSQSEVSSL